MFKLWEAARRSGGLGSHVIIQQCVMMAPASLLIFYVVLVSVKSVRVIDFEEAQYASPGSPATLVVLTKTPSQELPSRFIICFSTKQSKTDNKAPFILHGEDGTPWLAISFGHSGLWLDIQKGTWRKAFPVQKPSTHVWMHICADVDTLSGNISVSLNGQLSAVLNSIKLKSNKPKLLKDKIEIGLTNASLSKLSNNQFFGRVANINIFYPHNKPSIVTMSSKACTGGDFMDWSTLDFLKKGGNIKVYEEIVCDEPRISYDILLPILAKWPEAENYCDTLGHGRMTGIHDSDQLNTTSAWVKETQSSCIQLWLPISDRDVEGVYMNTNTGTGESFLPWTPGQPTGDSTQNYVSLYLQENAYNDHVSWQNYCFSCTLSRAKLFKLRGLCKDSLLGRVYSR